MLLTCPHCSDVAEIPSIFRKFYDMPIACHSCTGVFYVPQNVNQNAPHSVREHHHQKRCNSCRVTLMIPASHQSAKGSISLLCPACKSEMSNSWNRQGIQGIKRPEFYLPLVVGATVGVAIVYAHQMGMIDTNLTNITANFGNYLETVTSMVHTTMDHIERIVMP